MNLYFRNSPKKTTHLKCRIDLRRINSYLVPILETVFYSKNEFQKYRMGHDD